jgi:D-threonate/D-erythronate kinase
MLTETAPSNRLAAAATKPAMRVRLLADDLTGACDAGAAFLKAGHSVRIWFGEKALFPAAETAQAFHTASRALPAEEAAQAVSQAAGNLVCEADTIFFKKIDSAGRGPIAAEVLAAHNALGTRAILLAPAFPAAGRTVRNGVLEIRDDCGQNAQVKLSAWFASEMQSAIALISRPGDIAAAVEAGKTILICDSAEQEDLNALARATEPLRGLLYAGSAGLAQAIANLHPASAPPAPAAAAARILVITGTPHPVTARQLATLEQEAHEEIRILRIECRPGDDKKVRAWFADFAPDALVLTGGDTAQLAAQALGAHSILLHGEFAPGVPWGRLQGGVAEGRIAVTKSGGFGSGTALRDIVANLSGVA